jgi:hypothetical protein
MNQDTYLAEVLLAVEINENILSRTTRGVYDRSSSLSKPDMVISGGDLYERALGNLKRAYNYLFSSRNTIFSNWEEVNGYFDRLLEITHGGIFARDSVTFRTWNPSYTKYEFGELPYALSCFYDEYCERIQGQGKELENFSWATRAFDTDLHPYGDGCGRLSRLHGALFLVRAGHRLPVFKCRESYYRAMSISEAEFLSYVRDCVKTVKLLDSSL